MFLAMSLVTPLQGDDWGYALNGQNNNPFYMAYQFYLSWSGRYFSELWGFIIAPNKILWVILNPLFFTAIYLCLYRLANIKKHHVLIPIFLLASILSVDDHMRMQTYTWIMGTTYVIPLLISLIYFCLIDALFKQDFITKKMKKITYGINILLFIACLMMENISFSLWFSTIVLCFYTKHHKPHLLKYLIINFITCSFSFIILRLSPGANFRLLRDSAQFASLTFLEKIISTYPTFIEKTFIQNNYTITLFSLSLIICIFYSKKKISRLIKLSLISIQIVAIINLFSFILLGKTHFLTSPYALYSLTFWPFYVCMIFISIYLFMSANHQKNKALFLLFFAGLNAVVMLASPIYGPRSARYSVFYLFEVSILLLEDQDFKMPISIIFTVFLIALIANRADRYWWKYNVIYAYEKERQAIIEYYRDHPEVKVAKIPRFPKYTTHSSDIEADNIYHLETFKQYYQLPQEAKNIIFYFKNN